MQTLLMKNLKQKPFVFSVKIGCISGYIGKNCRSWFEVSWIYKKNIYDSLMAEVFL